MAKNPFENVATEKAKKGGGNDKIMDAPSEIKFSVDEYKRIDAEIKKLTGEQGGHKSIVEMFARSKFAERQVAKKAGNFSIQGDSESVSFVVMNASKGMTASEYREFATKYGGAAAQELLQLNPGSVKFNKETLEEPGVMDQVVKALSSLPDDLMSRLFTPAFYTVTEDVAVKAREHAKTPDKYQQLLSDLKITAYIRG